MQPGIPTSKKGNFDSEMNPLSGIPIAYIKETKASMAIEREWRVEQEFRAFTSRNSPVGLLGWRFQFDSNNDCYSATVKLRQQK